jgi:hypothetical protein
MRGKWKGTGDSRLAFMMASRRKESERGDGMGEKEKRGRKGEITSILTLLFRRANSSR